MRFLVSDALSGVCIAAIVVFAAGQPQETTPISGAVVPAQDSTQRSGSVAQRKAERGPEPEDLERTFTGAAEGDRPSTIVTASITAGDTSQKAETASLSRLPSFPAIDPSARKPSGGLGAAADGGIDAYVPPIVRQRPVTPPLKASADGKPKQKVKVKSAASAKSRTQGKQASVR
jgi:hypothetical protein